MEQFNLGFEKCHQGAQSQSKFSRSISVVNDSSNLAKIDDGRQFRTKGHFRSVVNFAGFRCFFWFVLRNVLKISEGRPGPPLFHIHNTLVVSINDGLFHRISLHNVYNVTLFGNQYIVCNEITPRVLVKFV